MRERFWVKNLNLSGPTSYYKSSFQINEKENINCTVVPLVTTTEMNVIYFLSN